MKKKIVVISLTCLFLFASATSLSASNVKKENDSNMINSEGRVKIVDRELKIEKNPDFSYCTFNDDGPWDKLYGGHGCQYGYSVQQTNDGGYILAGASYDYDVSTNYDVYLIKTDIEGNVQWEKTYLFNEGDSEFAYSVQQTIDGGYIVVGSTGQAESGLGFFLRINSQGNQQWVKTYGDSNVNKFYSVIQTNDGGYIVTGKTNYFYDQDPNGDVWLLKADSNGNKQWEKTFGQTQKDEIGYSVIQDQDGGYVIVGFTESYGAGGEDIWLIKTNGNGDMIWDQTYGSSGKDIGKSVKKTSDGGYIITGCYDEAVCLIKTDGNGNQAWYKIFEETGVGGSNIGNGVDITPDGGYIIAGIVNTASGGGSEDWSGRNFGIIRTDSNGELEWMKFYGHGDMEMGYDIQTTSDGGSIAIGWYWGDSYGDTDFWLIKNQEFPVKPDFKMKKIWHYPPYLESGEEVEFFAWFGIDGELDAPPFSIKLRIDGEDMGDWRLGGGLPQGYTVYLSGRLTWAGDAHSFSFEFDPYNEVKESNEENNIASERFPPLTNNPPVIDYLQYAYGKDGSIRFSCLVYDRPENDWVMIKYDWGEGTQTTHPEPPNIQKGETGYYDEMDGGYHITVQRWPNQWPAAGKYLITLTVIDQHGATAELSKEVIILRSRTADKSNNFQRFSFLYQFIDRFPLIEKIISFNMKN